MRCQTFNLLHNLDILWGQPIKQNQVASTSELLENQRRPQKPQKLTALKIKSEKFGPKF